MPGLYIPTSMGRPCIESMWCDLWNFVVLSWGLMMFNCGVEKWLEFIQMVGKDEMVFRCME